MFNRFCFGALLLAGLAVPLTGCSNASSGLDSISISPNTDLQLVTGNPATIQLTVTGTFGNGRHPTTGPVANVSFASAIPLVARVTSPAGVVSAVSPGTTTITATAQGYNGPVTASVEVTVVQGSTGPGGDIVSIAITPSTQTVNASGQTSQFIAIGTNAAGATYNLTGDVVWSSSSTSIATICNAVAPGPISPAPCTGSTVGLATAVSQGTSTVTALYTNAPDQTTVTGTATFTINSQTKSEPLASLAIFPATQTVQVGNTVANFIAIGTTGTGATVNLTDPNTFTVPGSSPANTIQWAQWTSSNPAVAYIDPNTGVINAKSAGATAITAIATNLADGSVVTGSAILTVSATSTSEPLVSLTILPATQTSLATGPTADVNFIAIGTTASGATVDLTNATASKPYVVPNTTPKQSYSVQWSSSNPLVATFTPTINQVVTPNSPGVATPISAGATAITAEATNSYDGSVVTASAAYTVTIPAASEPYVSLAIVPSSQILTSIGQQANFIAIGTTGSGTTVDLTNKGVVWSSSDANGKIVTPVSNGVFSAVANGVVAVTATYNNSLANGNASDLTSVTASGALTVAISATPEPLVSMSIVPDSQTAAAGQAVRLLALGTFSSSAPASIGPGQQNMASASVSAIYTVNWYSSNPSVATICSQGLPAASCTGVPDGVLTGVSAGTTAITAIASGNTDHSQVTATATFTVSGLSASTISALSIFPASQSITMPEIGQPNPTVNLVVIGTNGAGLQTNVTSQISWTSSNPAVVPTTNCSVPGSSPATGCNIISGANSAVVTAIGPGTTTITASFTNPAVGGGASSVVTQIATLTVTGPAAEPLLSLAIVPNAPSVQFPTQTTQLTAIGTSPLAPVTQNLTTTVTWSSSNPLIATVCNAVATTTPAVPVSCATTPGMVTGVAQGTAAITATTTNPDGSFVYATVPFTVQEGSADQMTSLTIVPNAISLSATGQPGSLIALGTFTGTGLQEDVTGSPQLAWSSSNQAIATVSTLGAQTTTCALNNDTPPVQVCTPDLPGVVKGVSVGSTDIVAEWTNPAVGTNPATVVTATATVTVTSTPAAEPLLAITVLPAAVTIGDLYGTGQFLAFGTFSTAPTSLDITNGFFHAGFSSPQYPSSACTDAYATADAATAAADAAANPPLALNNLPNPQCQFTPVTWVSLPDPFVFPINSAGAAGAKGGLITAEDPGTEDVYAVAANPDGTLVYSSPGPSGGGFATFSCPYVPPTYAILDPGPPVVYDFTKVLDPGSCNGLTVNNSLVSTLTVFDANLTSTGLNQSNWELTANSATTPPVQVIHCGPGSLTGGSVCEATYPNGSVVTVTAPAQSGVSFGGWSDNCTPTAPITAAGPNSCNVVVGGVCTYNTITTTYVCTSSNTSVGAIFN
jgi:uncharacterized protein YjdB